jgi:16S rRNA (uracil1498-N3)-methyltransferase
MQLFYTSCSEGENLTIDPEESWHMTKSLRMRVGDSVHVTNGKGWIYQGTLSSVQSGGCIVSVESATFQDPPACSLHIAIAPTKNIDRFEWFLEKATEIGISEITPLICSRSERTTIKPARLEKILVSAMKQSMNVWLPTLNEAEKYNGFLRKSVDGQRFIASCISGKEEMLWSYLQPSGNVTILIGPEGDFSPEELNEAVSSGFVPVSLGPSRYRTETAGVVACHTVRMHEINSTLITNVKQQSA